MRPCRKHTPNHYSAPISFPFSCASSMTELPKRPSRLWLTRSRRVVRCEFVWLVRFIFGQTTCENIKTNWAKQTNFTLRWSSLWKTERLFRSLCRWNPPFPSLIRDVIRCQDTCDESASARMIDAINITTWLDKRQKVQRKSDETRPSKSWRAQNNLTNLELNRLIQEIESAKVLGEGSRFKFFASLYGL